MTNRNIRKELIQLKYHLYKFWHFYKGDIPLKQALLSTRIIEARIKELEQKLK